METKTLQQLMKVAMDELDNGIGDEKDHGPQQAALAFARAQAYATVAIAHALEILLLEKSNGN